MTASSKQRAQMCGACFIWMIELCIASKRHYHDEQVCVRAYVHVCMSVCTHACDQSTCRGPRCLQWGISAQTVLSSHTPPWSPPEP